MLLHIADKAKSSWSLRPWLLMKVAGIGFEEREHAFLEDKAEQKAQWLRFSPTGRLPVLEDGGEVVWDSLAICLHLAGRYPQLLPEDAAARSWSLAAAAEMHSGFTGLRTQCPFVAQPAPAVVPDAVLSEEIDRLDELWQQGLSRFGGGFLAGSRFTLADAFYAPVAVRLVHYGLSEELGKMSRGYVQRIYELPDLQAWLKTNG